MARSKSSAGYPASFNALLTVVGENEKEVMLPVEGTSMNVNSLRTTLQCFIAAVRREGATPNATQLEIMKAKHAAKIIVRIQGNSVVVSHRDKDKLGLLVNEAILAAIEGSSVACHDGPLEPCKVGGVVSAGHRDGPLGADRDVGEVGGGDEYLAGIEAKRVRVHGVSTGESRALLGELEALPRTLAPETIGTTPTDVVGGKMPPITTAPLTMLDMVAGEQSAPRPAVEQKYKRADGKPYPANEDGEPTWGFNADNEPKLNQFF